MQAAKENQLQLDCRGTYVAGISHLYEFDFGNLSGWMYRVNGVFPDVGCGEYQLSDDDRIEWLYTCDLGRDLCDPFLLKRLLDQDQMGHISSCDLVI